MQLQKRGDPLTKLHKEGRGRGRKGKVILFSVSRADFWRLFEANLIGCHLQNASSIAPNSY